ncbi:MAG: hypothetical protein U0P30_12320 [Vicinamibacterales bacterium]
MFDGLDGVAVIRLSDGRGFLALEPGKGYADLELAVADRSEAPGLSPERRQALANIRQTLREWRQAGLRFDERSILVVDRQDVGTKARSPSGLAPRMKPGGAQSLDRATVATVVAYVATLVAVATPGGAVLALVTHALLMALASRCCAP